MRYLLLTFTFILFLSCEKNTTTINSAENGIISLSVGNEYLYSENSVSGDSVYVLSEWETVTTIVRDTIISRKRYFIFDNHEILRTDDKTVLHFTSNGPEIKFEFDVKVGESLVYDNMFLQVTEITDEPILGEQQKVICASNIQSYGVETIELRYSTKFGLISLTRSAPSVSKSKRLVGARIASREYGRIY